MWFGLPFPIRRGNLKLQIHGQIGTRTDFDRFPRICGPGQSWGVDFQFDVSGHMPVGREKRPGFQGFKHACGSTLGDIEPGFRKLARPIIHLGPMEIGVRLGGPDILASRQKLVPDPAHLGGNGIPTVDQ